MRRCLATSAIALAGCGRIGFDALGFGDGVEELIVDPAAAVVNVGSQIPIAVSGGEPPYAFALVGEGTMVGNAFVAPTRAGSTTIEVTDAAARNGSAVINYEGTMLFVAGGTVGGNEVDSVLASADGASWTQVGLLPAPRANGALVVYDDRMLYLGGLDQNGIPSDTVFASTNGVAWNLIGKLPADRSGLTATIHLGEIWIVGGFSTAGNTATTFHSADGMTWTPAAPIMVPRHENDVISRGGRLFVLGGHSDATFLGDIQVTTDGSQWAPAGTLNIAVDFPAAGELGDRVFRVCGSACAETETSLDLQTWTLGAALPGGRGDSPALVGFGDRLLVIGGGQTVLSTVDGSSWVTIGSLPQARSLTAAVQFTPR